MPSMFRSHHGRAYAAGTRAVKSRQEERDGVHFRLKPGSECECCGCCRYLAGRSAGWSRFWPVSGGESAGGECKSGKSSGLSEKPQFAALRNSVPFQRCGARFNRHVVPSLNRNKGRCAVQLLGSAWPGMEQVGLSPTRPSPYVPPNGQRIMLMSFR